MTKRNIKRPPALQLVYLDRVQANLKLHSSEHDYDKKFYQCTQPGAWGLQRKEHCTFTQRRNQSLKKTKFKAKYLHSLKRSYWQILNWNVFWGMDVYIIYTSYWLDYCTISHWQVKLKKVKKTTYRTLKKIRRTYFGMYLWTFRLTSLQIIFLWTSVCNFPMSDVKFENTAWGKKIPI